MSRFSSKPKYDATKLHGSTIRWMQKTDKQRKRCLAAKKAAATRKRNRVLRLTATTASVDPGYLEDLRAGLHKGWSQTPKESKPVIPRCEDYANYMSSKTTLVKSACVGHATDFVEYVWHNCPAHYFNAVLEQLAQKLADMGTTYPRQLRNEAGKLAGSIAARSR